jgi:uracil-DNA glycosylase family 4
VTLGNFATKLLLDTKTGITKLRGQEFTYRSGAVLVPTLHPAAVLRGGGVALAQTRADFVVVKRALARTADS